MLLREKPLPHKSHLYFLAFLDFGTEPVVVEEAGVVVVVVLLALDTEVGRGPGSD